MGHPHAFVIPFGKLPDALAIGLVSVGDYRDLLLVSSGD